MKSIQINWKRWHELLNLSETRGLTRLESIEFNQYKSIVTKLDAQVR